MCEPSISPPFYKKSISILNAMRMKNEQRYRGIMQAKMKELGVLLPKGVWGMRREARCRKKSGRKMALYFFSLLSLVHLSFIIVFSLLGSLIVNQCTILARQQPRTEHPQTSI